MTHKVTAIGVAALVTSLIYLNWDAIQKAWNEFISNGPKPADDAKPASVAKKSLPPSEQPKPESVTKKISAQPVTSPPTSITLSPQHQKDIIRIHRSTFSLTDRDAYRTQMEAKFSVAEKNALYNKDLKRFRHEYPTYQSTRVRFPDVSPPINANWILSDKSKRTLVITDAPLPKHINSFWQTMGNIATNAITIIMISHRKEKGKLWNEYWPQEGHYDGGNFTLHINKQKHQSDCTHRTMILEKGRNIQVEHFHFDTWTDGTDDVSIQTLGDLVYQVALEETPLVIHCSAGINRSGVVAAAYIAVRKIIKEYKCDVALLNAQPDPHRFMKVILAQLRNRKVGRSPHMLQDANQYVLLHTIVSYICEQHFKQKWEHFPLKK